MQSLTLAMIQLAVRGGDRDGNLTNAAKRVAEASAQGADVALLPECMDLGWTDPSCQELAGGIPDGPTCQTLMQMAADHQIMICAGITERSGDAIYNAAVLIDQQGRLIGHHRKINELTCAHDLYAIGDRLTVIPTDLGTIGLMICADGFAKDQVLSRSLGYMGADIILSPSAWAVDADHDNHKDPYGDWWRQNYAPVARAFAMPIIGVSNVGPITAGPWQGRICIGCSLAIDHTGKELLMGSYGVDAEEVRLVDIEMPERPAKGTGWNEL